MEPESKFKFLLLVLFFCGSVVLMASHDLIKIYKNREGNPEAARKLIQHLKGVQPPTKASLKRDFDQDSTMDQWKGKQYKTKSDERSELRKLLDAMVDSEGSGD